MAGGAVSAAAVKTLNRAMYPSLSGCSLQWGYRKEEKLNEVFYNELVSSYALMSDREFQNMNFTFKCAEIVQTYAAKDFGKVPKGTGLYKMAAKVLVNKEKDTKKREQLSLKY